MRSGRARSPVANRRSYARLALSYTDRSCHAMSGSHETILHTAPLKTIKVHARDEDFRIVQLQGNLFVCSKAHGNCCCGWTEKGRAPVNLDLYQHEWERRKIRNKIHLSFTGCLGPCAV